MALVPKDLLYPGEWHLRDGRVFRCTARDVGQFAARLNDMRAAGLHVPVTWEHQPDIKPTTRAAWLSRNADMARMTAGYATAARDAGGVLCGDLEIPDEADRKQLPKTRFVSPMIEWDYRDPTGKVWDGPSITHIAITPAPVQHTQQPFGSPNMTSGAGSSLPVAMSTLSFQPPITLSLAGYRPVALGDTAMADDTDYMPDEDMGATDMPPEMPDTAPMPDPLLAEVIGLLKAKNIVIPDDTTMDDLLPHLRTALMTHAAATGEGEQAKEPDGDEAAPGLEPRPETQMLMSQLSAATSRIKDMERRNISQRIDGLQREGKIDRRIAGDLKRGLEAVPLSLNDNAELVHNDLLTRLDAYEQLGRGTAAREELKAGAKPVALSQSDRIGGDGAGYEDDAATVKKLVAMTNR